MPSRAGPGESEGKVLLRSTLGDFEADVLCCAWPISGNFFNVYFEQKNNKVHRSKLHLNKVHRTQSHLNIVYRTKSHLNKVHRTKSHLKKSYTSTKYIELSHTSTKYIELSHISKKATPQQTTQN